MFLAGEILLAKLSVVLFVGNELLFLLLFIFGAEGEVVDLT